jgi:hypothetical protein
MGAPHGPAYPRAKPTVVTFEHLPNQTEMWVLIHTHCMLHANKGHSAWRLMSNGKPSLEADFA